MQTFKDGEYILKENGELSSDANFYLLDSGTVHCFKTFKVGMRPFKSLHATDTRNKYCSSIHDMVRGSLAVYFETLSHKC